jgi:hypothetical protein
MKPQHKLELDLYKESLQELEILGNTWGWSQLVEDISTEHPEVYEILRREFERRHPLEASNRRVAALFLPKGVFM